MAAELNVFEQINELDSLEHTTVMWVDYDVPQIITRAEAATAPFETYFRLHFLTPVGLKWTSIIVPAEELAYRLRSA